MNRRFITAVFASLVALGAARTSRAQQPTEAPPPTDERTTEEAGTAGYDGGFFIASGNNELELGGRVQPRFAIESVDGTDERSTEAAFSIARARLSLSGKVLDGAIAFKFQTDFGKGDVALKDFYVDYRLGSAPVFVRAGQFKRPFARQQLTSSSKLALVDRAITDKAFGNGRDIGLALHNGFSKSPAFEWTVGVFNGTGDAGVFELDPDSGEIDRSNVPDTMRPAIVARAGVNQGGIKGYSEADLEGGPLRSAVGVSAMALLDADGGDDAALRFGADYNLKAFGWSATGGVFFEAVQDGDGAGDLGFAQIGAFTDLAYVLAGRYQPALRYAVVDAEGDANVTHEILGGFSLYAHGHAVKWQTDAGVLVTEGSGDSTTDLRARTQLQVSF